MESDARSESDAASGRSSESSEVEEVEETIADSGRNASSFRKRSLSRDKSSSDAEKGSARKIPTSGRGAGRATGKGRGGTSQEEAAERAKRLAAEGRHPAAMDPSGPSGSEKEDSAEESRRSFGELVVAALRDMGRKRERTSKERTVLRHAASMQEAFDVALRKSVAKLQTGQTRRVATAANPAGAAPQAKKQQQVRPTPPAAAPKKGKAAPATKAAGAPAVAASRRPRPPPQPADPPAEAGWQVAGAKKQAGKAARAARRRERQKLRKRTALAARIRNPRSTAVVITLQPEAAKKGATYGEVLRKAKQAVNLTDLGITGGFQMRHTATGALMLEVPGANSGPTADALAEKIRAIFDAEEARVSRPTRCVDMRIMGLDDSVTVEEVVAAVARAGGCPADQVRAGTIRADGTGMGAVTVNCPVPAARSITGEGKRLLVGWVSARVKLLEPRPLRCYRCHVGHHVGVCCAAEEDRSDSCFQCGQSGHKADTCSAAPHCYACAAAGKSADHRAGSRTCDPPAKAKGKVPRPIPARMLTAAAAPLAAAAIASADAAAATTAAGPSRRAREETVMDCQ